MSEQQNPYDAEPGPPEMPSPPPMPGTGRRADFASFWQRLLARIIDALILGVVGAVLGALVLQDDIADAVRAGQFDRWSLAESGELLTFSVITTLIAAAYEIILHHQRGQTVGKMALGITVLQIEDGRFPAWDRAFIRWLVPAVAGWIPVVGWVVVLVIYLWMLWDPDRQGLHDKAARTIVVRGARQAV